MLGGAAVRCRCPVSASEADADVLTFARRITEECRRTQHSEWMINADYRPSVGSRNQCNFLLGVGRHFGQTRTRFLPRHVFNSVVVKIMKHACLPK